MNQRRRRLMWIAFLAIGTSALYFHKLSSSPPYLSIEEVSHARHALRLAETGRDESGQRLPLFFSERGRGTLRDPVWLYLTAGLLKMFPFSETVVRAASACAGVLNVVLMFIVASRLFGGTWAGVIGASLLAATPAHFVHSRIATSQIGTVTFTLAWLVFLLHYLDSGRRARFLVLAVCCLAAGMYSYAAALMVMPAYFLVTLFVVWHTRPASTTPLSVACAAFLVALAPMIVWHGLHARQIASLADYYTHGEYNKGLGAAGFLGAKAISHFDAWWDCYSPDKLFFSGDADLRFSTRSAGYLLLSAGVFIAIGFWTVRRQLPFEASVLIASGVVLAPLPAAAVTNSEIKRWLTFVPFAVAVATGGAAWMLADRRRAVRISAVALLVIAVLQARAFFSDYFSDYPERSAVKFGGNLRGAIHEVLDASGPDDCVLLDGSIYYLPDHWDLYTRANHRADLAQRTTWLRPQAGIDAAPSCVGTTALAAAGDPRFTGWRSVPIPELDGTVALAVFRRDAQ